MKKNKNMHQKQINKNVDYLYKLQINETEHQNHRLGWILAAQALIFTSLCALLAGNYGKACDFQCCVIIPLIVVIGVLLSISGIYSVVISETSIGMVYENWDDYDKQPRAKKDKPLSHFVSLAPDNILRSSFGFLQFYSFAPNVFCAAWMTLLILYLFRPCIDCQDLMAVIIIFFVLLLFICLIAKLIHRFLLYQWYREEKKKELGKKQKGHPCHEHPCHRHNRHHGQLHHKTNRNTKQTANIINFKYNDWSIYHIMIDRFNGDWTTPPAMPDKDGFYGGTLNGIKDKLKDYIKPGGYNAIMLTPIYKTAEYHGYHTVDFNEIDSRFGDWSDFDKLIKEAHNLGIKVICDFVPNHCHRSNKFFQDALNNKNSIYRDWFFFDEGKKGGYVSYQNYPDLPKFNLYNKMAAEYLIGVAENLVKDYYIDGLRIDHAIGTPFHFLRQLRKRLKRINPNILVFGEVWASSLRDISQIEFKNEERRYELVNHDANIQEHLQMDYIGVLDGVLDFKFRDIMVEAAKQVQGFNGNRDLEMKLECHFRNYPSNFVLLPFLDNHDTDRFLFTCDGDVNLRNAAFEIMRKLRYPHITYYGTEINMMNVTSICGRNNADGDVRSPMDWSIAPSYQ
ncbi:MAG: hypothetical protein K6G32_08245 [Prevotella sp.]|nr:hypothetical protein [Prevotella sp.]